MRLVVIGLRVAGQRSMIQRLQEFSEHKRKEREFRRAMNDFINGK